MVRIKHRYLLINFLYPETTASADKNAETDAVPNVVAFHSPSPDALTPSLLIRGLREQIIYLFGDYGAGKTSSALKGKGPDS